MKDISEKVKEELDNIPMSYEMIKIIDENFIKDVIESDLEGDELGALRVNKTLGFLSKYLKVLKECYLKSLQANFFFPMICEFEIEKIEKWIDDANAQVKKEMRKFRKECPNPSKEQQDSINEQLKDFQGELDKAYAKISELENKQKNYDLFRAVNDELKNIIDLDGDNNMTEEADRIQRFFDKIFYDDGNILHPTEKSGTLAGMLFYSRLNKIYEEHEEYHDICLEKLLAQLDD